MAIKPKDLTEENYYTDLHYLDVSGYKECKGTVGMRGCEERFMAHRNGEWSQPMTDPMIVGSIVDSCYDGTINEFLEAHPDVISQRGATKGQLKSTYQKGLRIFERCERDPLFHLYMSGEHQVIETGEIAGVPFKIKTDSLHDGKAIVDLKVVRDIHQTYYVPDVGHMNFIEYWNYDLQLAVYQEIHRQNTGDRLPCYIAAADKGEVTDIAVIQIPQGIMDQRLEEVKRGVQQVKALMDGDIIPVRCETCDYCKATKVLDSIMSMDELLLDVE